MLIYEFTSFIIGLIKTCINTKSNLFNEYLHQLVVRYKCLWGVARNVDYYSFKLTTKPKREKKVLMSYQHWLLLYVSSQEFEFKQIKVMSKIMKVLLQCTYACRFALGPERVLRMTILIVLRSAVIAAWWQISQQSLHSLVRSCVV